MRGWVLAQNAADTASALHAAGVLADASPPVMLAILIIALLRGWLVLPRETRIQQQRMTELAAERDEYKRLAFQAVGLGERVATVVEHRRPE